VDFFLSLVGLLLRFLYLIRSRGDGERVRSIGLSSMPKKRRSFIAAVCFMIGKHSSASAVLIFFVASTASGFKLGKGTRIPTNQERQSYSMPYIKKERRDAIMAGAKPQDAGELNFAISVLVDGFLQSKGGIKYSHLNEVVGALDCAKLELYRRLAVPYEDKKIEENGDVYRSSEAPRKHVPSP
jgi:hypothetical protein